MAIQSLTKEVSVERLRDSMEWSAKQLTDFRNRNAEAVRLFAGSRYGGASMDKSSMNMLQLAINVWRRQLAAQTPRCLTLTRSPDLKARAKELEIAMDYLLQEINFGSQLQEVVQSAIFLMGVMKVGISNKYLHEGSSFLADSGQPYAEPVLFEDWLHDMNARRKEEWDWCGNRYRLPLDMVMENPEFDSRVKDKLEAAAESSYENAFSSGVDEYDSQTSRMSSGDSIQRTEYIKHIDLWDLWIPHDNLFVTMPVQSGLKPLLVREWEGPERGPFHLLSYMKVPGNIIPASPAQQLYDMQELLTMLFNHLARQASRQKNVTVCDSRTVADGTAERLVRAEDGQVIRTNHIEGIKEIRHGGIDPASMTFVQWLRQMFSYMGGNIDSMGGLAQQGDTLGQEKLLAQSSSEMIRDMQSRTIDFTKDVITDLAWYLHTDPLVEIPLVRNLEGYGEIPFSYSPESRKWDFFRVQFDIAPYSLQSKGPQQRLQTIMQMITQFVMPMSQQMSEWGLQVNIKELLHIISTYSDLPELETIISSSSDRPGDELRRKVDGSSTRRPLQSPVTSRQYTRENVSTGGTQASRENQMMQSLMKAASQTQGGM